MAGVLSSHFVWDRRTVRARVSLVCLKTCLQSWTEVRSTSKRFCWFCLPQGNRSSARPIYRSHMCHVCGVKPGYGVTKDGRLAIVLAESNCIRCAPEGLPAATYVTGIQYLVTLPSVRKSASVIACVVFNLNAYAQRGYATCCGLAVTNVNGRGICPQKIYVILFRRGSCGGRPLINRLKIKFNIYRLTQRSTHVARGDASNEKTSFNYLPSTAEIERRSSFESL